MFSGLGESGTMMKSGFEITGAGEGEGGRSLLRKTKKYACTSYQPSISFNVFSSHQVH